MTRDDIRLALIDIYSPRWNKRKHVFEEPPMTRDDLRTMNRRDLTAARTLLHILVQHEQIVIYSNLPYGDKPETSKDPYVREARRNINTAQRLIGTISRNLKSAAPAVVTFGLCGGSR